MPFDVPFRFLRALEHWTGGLVLWPGSGPGEPFFTIDGRGVPVAFSPKQTGTVHISNPSLQIPFVLCDLLPLSPAICNGAFDLLERELVNKGYIERCTSPNMLVNIADQDGHPLPWAFRTSSGFAVEVQFEGRWASFIIPQNKCDPGPAKAPIAFRGGWCDFTSTVAMRFPIDHDLDTYKLTPVGRLQLQQWAADAGGAVVKAKSDLPEWDAEARELRFRGVVCKSYHRNPAKNQTLVLQCFEEAGWPRSLDNPLVGTAAAASGAKAKAESEKKRLKDTVEGLNAQLAGLHFHRNGTGEAVLWEPAS